MEREYEVSYLIARDPSIVAFNRTGLTKIKFNLASVVDNESVVNDKSTQQTEKEEDKYINVYLRIKGDSGCYDDIYEVNDNCITCRRSGDHIKKNYIFSNIFGPEAQQADIFHYIAKPKLVAFINGRNSSLFTYGSSGSGKTFTIVGTPEDPGLIPRSLEYIFRSVSKAQDLPELIPSPDGHPQLLNHQLKVELDSKKSSIITATLKEQDLHIRTYKQMQERLSSESVAEVEDQLDASVSLWVSFSEIYNETIYDLLVPPASREKPRHKLCLGKNKDDISYIKNLTVINVYDGLEAYQILQYGLQNLNYASTAVNVHSSRSHSIFTIYLIQSSKHKDDIFISRFNFCDLAGSERLKKTLNFGDRLRESKKINTSLLVLGRCMDNIRKYQQTKDHRLMIPFRESKLTQLFQSALMGNEGLEMIININPSKCMFDETLHVLNFSAIVKTIIVEEPKIHGKKTRFSLMMEQGPPKYVSNSVKEENKESKMLKEIEDLKEEIKILSRNQERLQRQLRERSMNEEENLDLRQAYEELIEERDNIVANLDKKIDKEKENVAQAYKDLVAKMKESHEYEIKSIREEYEQGLSESRVVVISSSSSSGSSSSSSGSSSSDSGSSSEDDDDLSNKLKYEKYKKVPRKNLIEKIIKLEEMVKDKDSLIEEAKHECLSEQSEKDRYRELWRVSLSKNENCDVSFA